MNKSVLGLISALLAMSYAKNKGSKSYWNNFLMKSEMWKRVFCHQGSPTYSFIGDISYIKNVFEDMGFELTNEAPDVLYSHILLQQLEQTENTFFSLNPESQNFFDLYKALSQNEIPVFILGINRIAAPKKNIDEIIKALSITINGSFPKNNDATVKIWDPLSQINQTLKRLYYHSYVINLKAEDTGLPLYHQEMTYVIGFKAITPDDKKDFPYYLPQPIFNTQLDFSSFIEVIPSNIIGLEPKTSTHQVIEPKTLENLNEKSYSSHFIDVNNVKAKQIYYPFRYQKKGKSRSHYIKQNNQHRTLSVGEIISLHDIPFLPDKNTSYDKINRLVQRYSFTRGLDSILSELSFLFKCSPSENETVRKFYSDYSKVRVIKPYKSVVKIGGMFSGIGGFELGIKRGLAFRGLPSEVCWDYEIDKTSSDIFSSHFPKSINYGDILKFTNPASVDIVTMGFPCPDVSQAGLRKGIKKGTRSGLFLDAFDICMNIKPRMILLENVEAILRKDRSSGVAPIEVVINKFASKGWTLEWVVVSAKEFGAPHRRERWFCIAHKEPNLIMLTPNEEFNVGNKYPKYGFSFQGKTYSGTPMIPFDMSIRSPIYLPTPIASDWHKRPTGGLRMRLQENVSRSVGRDRKYPQQLPPGYEWVKRKNKMVSRKIGGHQKVLNPYYVQWMMGFPEGWIDKKRGGLFDPFSWSEGAKIPQLIDQNEITNKDVFKSLGNAILPQIPEFIAYAYLWEYFT